MNGGISVQTIHTSNKNVTKLWVNFIVYGTEVKQQAVFWYLNLKGKEH